MSATEVSKQQPAGGIEISQSDLLQAASSMGPSVSDSERRKYQAMYVLNILKCSLWAGGGSLRGSCKKRRGGKLERVKRNLSPIPSSKFLSPRPPTRPYCFWHLRRRPGEWNAGGNHDNCSLGQTPPQSSFIISEFTEQDDRKKRMTKRLSVTNVTGLLLVCFVGNSLNMDIFCSSTKRSV